MRNVLETFVKEVELNDIGVYEIVVHRGQLGEDGTREIVGPGENPEGELSEPSFELEIVSVEDANQFLIRLRASAAGKSGEVAVGVQAEFTYGSDGNEDLNQDLLLSFAEEVGVMAIAPYMRHQLNYAVSTVLGLDMNLGLLKPGTLKFRE